MDRELQALHLLRMLTVDEVEVGTNKTRWHYTLTGSVDPSVLHQKCDQTESGEREEAREGTHKSGEAARWGECSNCGRRHYAPPCGT